jgi:starvation-inducible outer membrane lipoprotein
MMKILKRVAPLIGLALLLSGCVIVPEHFHHGGGCGWYHNCW